MLLKLFSLLLVQPCDGVGPTIHSIKSTRREAFNEFACTRVPLGGGHVSPVSILSPPTGGNGVLRHHQILTICTSSRHKFVPVLQLFYTTDLVCTQLFTYFVAHTAMWQFLDEARTVKKNGIRRDLDEYERFRCS